MGFELTERVTELNARVEAIMREHICARQSLAGRCGSLGKLTIRSLVDR